jgi:hypothetical protein
MLLALDEFCRLAGGEVMSCDAQVFGPICPDKFAELQKRVSDSGLAISGLSGEAEYRGCVISWSYDPASFSLTIQCLKKPFIFSCGTINRKIEELIEGQDAEGEKS